MQNSDYKMIKEKTHKLMHRLSFSTSFSISTREAFRTERRKRQVSDMVDFGHEALLIFILIYGI